MKLRAVRLLTLMAALALALPLGCDEGTSSPDAAVEDGDGEADAGHDGASDGVDELDAADGADEAQPLPSVCPPCVPDCTDKQCGSDGCGGECENCLETGQGNVCMGNRCSFADWGDCFTHKCGLDPMFGTLLCGTCPVGWDCNWNVGLCDSPTGECSGVPETGLCLSGRAVTCQAGELFYQDCEFEACRLDPATLEAGCEEVPCLARCFGRTCGDDGCGGSCGSCAAGRTCQADLGVCVPESGCGEVGAAGECQGHTLVTCEAGAIQTEACLPEGKLCVSAEPGTRAGCCMPKGDEPCGDLPAYNQCEGTYILSCDHGALRLENCRWVDSSFCKRTGMQSLACGF
ncbi:MAG TPA: hypothetical protein P5147_21720 [Myxococcota bacterium]|nr:hypothetical protein [Myxococcota bacterium]